MTSTTSNTPSAIVPAQGQLRSPQTAKPYRVTIHAWPRSDKTNPFQNTTSVIGTPGRKVREIPAPKTLIANLEPNAARCRSFMCQAFASQLLSNVTRSHSQPYSLALFCLICRWFFFPASASDKGSTYPSLQLRYRVPAFLTLMANTI